MSLLSLNTTVLQVLAFVALSGVCITVGVVVAIEEWRGINDDSH